VRVQGRNRVLCGGPLFAPLKSPPLCAFRRGGRAWVFFLFQFYSESRWQAGLSGTSAELPKAQRAVSVPGVPQQSGGGVCAGDGGSRNMLVGFEVGRVRFVNSSFLGGDRTVGLGFGLFVLPPEKVGTYFIADRSCQSQTRD
jgi:hypothetical protein